MLWFLKSLLHHCISSYNHHFQEKLNLLSSFQSTSIKLKLSLNHRTGRKTHHLCRPKSATLVDLATPWIRWVTGFPFFASLPQKSLFLSSATSTSLESLTPIFGSNYGIQRGIMCNPSDRIFQYNNLCTKIPYYILYNISFFHPSKHLGRQTKKIPTHDNEERERMK